jgi:hypothetical protein
VSIKHAVDAEVRLLIVCFIEALTAIKKTFGIQNSNSLEIVKLRRTKFSFQSSGDKFQFQRLGYSIQIACQEN